jgi:hypothetical protein
MRMIAIWEAQEMMEGAASKRPASHVAAVEEMTPRKCLINAFQD